MHADGKLTADKGAFEVFFSNRDSVFGTATAGAPFNVYAPGRYQSRENPAVFEDVRTWAYGVRPGDTLRDTWPLVAFEGGSYHLRVYGPNGFFREFQGDAADPSVDISFDYQHAAGLPGKLTGNVVLTISNQSPQGQSLEITDHAYGDPMRRVSVTGGGKTSLALELGKNYGWYDFSVRVAGHEGVAEREGLAGPAGFAKRYAGHVETGKPGFSDPYMGHLQSRF